jgi:hypothetical protein
MESIFERSESHPQILISFLETYLAQETYGPLSEPARALRTCIELCYCQTAGFSPSILTKPHAITASGGREGESKGSRPKKDEPKKGEPKEGERKKGEPREGEFEEGEHKENPTSQSPPFKNAESARATTQGGEETETCEESAKSTTAPAPTLVAPHPTTALVKVNSTVDKREAVSAVITILSFIAWISPRPKTIIKVDAKRSRGPIYAERLFRELVHAFEVVRDMALATLFGFEILCCDTFEDSPVLFCFLALLLASLFTSLLVLTPHGAIALLVQFATNLVCFFASRSSRGHPVSGIERYNRALDVCMNHLLLFLVYTGLRRFWPSDSWTFNAMTWTLGTGLFTWTFVTYCVVHERPYRGRYEFSWNFLRR